MLGIDLGKNSCSLAGMDATGAVVMRKRMTRDAIVAFATTLPPCTIAMEACCGAHFLGRTLALHGHTIRLMSPGYVQPCVKAQKTDDRDAEAATRPTTRFISLKSEAQLDLQILHRVRERLVNARTALINQLRAVLLERGIILLKGRVKLMRRLEDLMMGDPAVSARNHTLLADLRDEWAKLDRRAKKYDGEVAALTREDVQARPLATIPGINVINATALLAAIGDGGRPSRHAPLGGQAEPSGSLVAGYADARPPHALFDKHLADWAGHTF